jgi:hypothetical protein
MFIAPDNCRLWVQMSGVREDIREIRADIKNIEKRTQNL